MAPTLRAEVQATAKSSSRSPRKPRRPPHRRHLGLTPQSAASVFRNNTSPSCAPRSHPARAVPVFVSRDWPALEANGNATANFNASDFVVESEPPAIILNCAAALPSSKRCCQFRYGKRILTARDRTVDARSRFTPPLHYARRLPPNAPRSLTSSVRVSRAPTTRLACASSATIVLSFARDYGRLQREWQVTMEERLQRSTSQNLERIEPRFEITPSGVQWFDLNVAYTMSGEKFSPADIQRLILSGSGHARLRNGKTAIIDTERSKNYRKCCSIARRSNTAKAIASIKPRPASLSPASRSKDGKHRRR